MRIPRPGEDARNLALIAGSAVAGLGLTAALLNGEPEPDPVERHVSVTFVREVVPPPPPVEVTPPPPPPAPPAPPVVSGASLDDRIYGTVVTRRGDRLRGYLRWDRNEGSWADLLDADKRGDRGSSVSGIRFGHVRTIVPMGSRAARFTLKSGERVEFRARATDLGSGLRALVVDEGDGRTSELGWHDIEAVEFEAAPGGDGPSERRLYGTLVTRGGLEFTGHVTWDVDEIYTTDVLDGEDEDGVDHDVRFGDIAVLRRNGSRATRVRLHDGTEMTLHGTNDVNSSNSGISVSDPALGQVKVDWDDFEEVRFTEAPASYGYDSFDGGRPLRGTVVTESGEELTGTIRWDRDEASTWEMLNGDARGVEFHVELSNVASIERGFGGAEVRLLDGRTFRLDGSNDVDRGNRGIEIVIDGRAHRVDWEDFRIVRFETP